ncbi:hypothetical protein ERO13_A11G201900v2 [Gossypium hirsutum]|uniref:C2 domain-containing protein n=5 Tax=Gossypium TaxID=3633 RepID=A0A1U8JBW6_GOSHI|nr:uncharacterized protein LOC107905621 [Gossypium hirsutum]KAB2058115.1 hypothetical protein ES319_A11G212700v1 [Gossypium barbadense]TYG94958.1 hypothetical protein ES288_A11G229400v1 [Gossypium darwinii]TYI01833.1 hypothetical protein ES332_A11G227900v1 [Gossypium tomentosum]TYJ10601.1 hypothetical protein E1A91_A11G218400v1 [Gossypium mustelinum]KAG4175725.1 hypothetical protein ERO13_A11G201900v2 [Gossypium hirsutum]
MGIPHFLIPSLCCELKVLQARNIELKYPGNLFVRYYLFAGSNKRVKVDSHEISSKLDPIWNESFSLECSGTQESINGLKQQTLVFELRCRSKMMTVLGKMGKSKLLGRAEIPWKAVLESPNMEIEKYWVTMSVNDCVLESLKPPSIQISMKLGEGPAIVETEKKKKRKQSLKNSWDGCGCKDVGGGCCSCADYEIFALAAAMEAL